MGGENFFDDVFSAEFDDILVVNIVSMLSGEDDVCDFDGFSVFVSNGDLRFTIRADPFRGVPAGIREFAS